MVGTGVWRAKAIDARLCETSKGTPQVAVQFKALEGLFEGDSITWYGFLTEKTRARTIESLRILGWSGDDIRELATARGEAEIVVGEEEYEGKVHCRVQWVNRIGGRTQGQLDADRAAKIAAELREHVRAVDAAIAAGGKTPF